MITYVIGDIFQSPAKVLVNPVNTAGVMGKGLAHDFKRFYPDMFNLYRDICQDDQFEVGNLLLYKSLHKWVMNIPTKKHWRAKSRTEYLEAGLKKFTTIYSEYNIVTISFPALGTGAGGLGWEADVRPLMEHYLHPLPISVYVHLYDDQKVLMPKRRNVRGIRAWLMGQPQVVTFDKFWRDMTKLIKTQTDFKTFDDEDFRVGIAASKRGRHNMIIRTSDPQPIFIPETALLDLWQYVSRAGYVMPVNFPGGLEVHGRYLTAILSQIEYVQPVYLTPVGGEQVIGLHHIPSLSRRTTLNEVSVQAAQ